MSEHRQVIGVSIVARLPLAMFGLALLVHTQHLTGSFAVAGLVSGAYAAAVGVGGPLLGRVADRRGQTFPLVGGAAVAAAVLTVIALLPPSTVIVALAAVVGLATPPVAACARSLLPALIRDAEALRAAYAVESAAIEITFIAGPPLALGIGALWSTGAALAAGGAILLAATVAFALQPASRAARPHAETGAGLAGSLCSPGMRTLVLILTAAGVLFGAVEVGVTAAAGALGGNGVAAPLLALWGAGSMAGGIVTAKLGGAARSGRGLGLTLAALAAGHLALGVALHSAVALGALIFLAGAWIAPVYTAIYTMVDDVAPRGTVTEAFAWLSTAAAVGAAAGSAVAGALIDDVGPQAAFGLAGLAGAAAVLLSLVRGATISARPPALPQPLYANVD
jgi:MFS family permease